MGETSSPALLILNQMAGPMTWELAEDLGAALGEVALLTGHPDTLAKGSRETVRLYPAAPYRRGSYLRRALSWLHYLVQAFFWLCRMPRNVPLLLFSNPPLLPWLGWLMRRLRGQSYAVMVHDVWPDVLVRMGVWPERRLVVRLWRWLNRRAYEQAGVVMTLGEAMAANLARQFDPQRTKHGRIEVIPPWADTDVIHPIPKEENWFAREHGQVGKLTVMYSGNMGMAHDIETMLAAARRLQDTPDVHFMFIGAGPKWQLVADAVQEHQLPNVTLLGWQPEESLPFSLAAADVGLVSLEDDADGLAMPSKVYYMMAAGTALLGLSRGASDLGRMIEQHQCGVNVEPGDVDGFVQAVKRFRDEVGFLDACQRRARRAAEAVYSRDVNIWRVQRTLAPILVVDIDRGASASSRSASMMKSEARRSYE
jgi:glycosyltransferase involved in cell wall biosynthesis